MPRRSYRKGGAYKTQGNRLQKMVGKPYKNVYSYKKLVEKVERLDNEIGSPEKKYNDRLSSRSPMYITPGGAGANDYSTAFGFVAQQIQLGPGPEQRIGEKIQMVDLIWNFNVDYVPGVAISPINYRVIIAVQKINTALTLDAFIKEYMQSANIAGDIYRPQVLPINRQLSANHVVLKDKSYVLDAYGIGLCRNHKIYKSLNIPSEYRLSTIPAAITDIESNVLWCIVIPESTVLSQTLFITSTIRLNYTDV